MPTNRNEPVWSSGPLVLSGGGNGALVLIPVDQDLFDVTVEVAAATTAQVEVTHDSYEDILGINERPIRYAQVAINDLGGSGELRMNAAAGQDFTDDGWAVGDTFEVVSHKAPTFGPEGTPPTTIADKQVYTVSSVAALVIGFTEDPAFSLAEGDIVVAQSRAAVAEDSLNWAQVGVDVAASTTDHFNISTACAARVIASGGTGAINYNFAGRMQSVIRPLPFVANVESRPYSGAPAGVEGIELVANAAPVWAEDVVAGPNGSKRHGTATVAGTDFDLLGVKQYDRLNFSGHSVTGNKGMKAVRRVTGTKVQFYEPLDGVAGTDDPRIRIGQYVSASSGVVLNDYDELVLQIVGASASYLRMQDSPWPATLNPVLDSGPAGRTDWDESYTAGPNFEDGPFEGTTSPNGNFSRFNTSVGAPSLGGASAQMTCGFWTIAREDAERDLASKATDGDSSSDFSMRTQSLDDTVEAHWKGPLLADPGGWLTDILKASGDRIRPVADDSNVYECEVVGTTAKTTAGVQEVDVANLKALADVPGLANDATVYTATVDVDGAASPQAIAVTGSLAQTYTLLIAELNTDTTGAVWSLLDGNLVCTSSTTGELSDIDIVDTDLFLALTSFVAINTSVVGDGEPSFPAIGLTVTDGALAAGFHDMDTGALLLGATATGLVNDATVYTMAVTIDGGSSQPIAVTGTAAQTYTTLLAELNTDTTGGTWALKNGELRCTSATTGALSTVAIVDTDLLLTLTAFVALNTAVVGTAVITWRHVNSRAAFHDVAIVGPSYVLDDWVFVAQSRLANGDFVLYVDGVEVGREGPDTADTTPGSFGSPVPRAFTIEYNTVLGDDVGLAGSGGGDPFTGDTAYFFIHHDGSFTAAEVLALYNTAVDIGIN